MPDVSRQRYKQMVKKVHQIWWNNFSHCGCGLSQIGRLLEKLVLKLAANLGGATSRKKKVITSSNILFLVAGAPQ
jgi:hypothetical protein